MNNTTTIGKLDPRRPRNKIRISRGDLIFDIISYGFLVLFVLAVIYPLYFVFIASFSDPYAVLTGEVLFTPKGLNVESYIHIFNDKRIWTGYWNSLLITFFGTLLNVSLTMTIAYPLSRRYFSGRKVITTILIITMYFSGGLIPTYILVQNLNLRNTFWVMIFLGAVNVYNVIIARTFLQSNITSDLEEAASIDGCSQFRFFGTMVIPLSKTIFAVLILYYGVAHWNEYMRGVIYLDSPDKYPLQVIIRSILIQSQIINRDTADVEEINRQMRLAEAMKYGVIIVSSLPVLLIYPIIQKHFVKGVMIGSLKG